MIRIVGSNWSWNKLIIYYMINQIIDQLSYLTNHIKSEYDLLLQALRYHWQNYARGYAKWGHKVHQVSSSEMESFTWYLRMGAYYIYKQTPLHILMAPIPACNPAVCWPPLISVVGSGQNYMHGSIGSFLFIFT